VRRPKLLLAVLALALCAIGGSAAPATAAPPVVTMGSVSDVSYASAHVEGEVDPEGEFVEWLFEASSDGGASWGYAGLAGTVEGSGSQLVEGTVSGLSPATAYKIRLTALNFTDFELVSSPEPSPELTTLAVSAPVVSIEPASSLTGTDAHFKGTVEAGGADPAFNATCAFDYVTDAQFQIDGFTSAQQIGCQPPEPIEGTGATAVEADPTDLLPNTTYHLRLRSSNLGGENTAEAPTFDEPKIAPTVVDTFPTEVSQGAARLNAKLRAGGDPTTYHFEYLSLSQYQSNGETFAGAKQTPEAASIGEDNSVHMATAKVSGLAPATAYRFRVVAGNGVDLVSGPAIEFTTAGVPDVQNCPNEALRAENNSLGLPDCRAYELVSPDSNHAIVQSVGVAGPSGSSMVYVLADAPESAGGVAAIVNPVLAKRDPGSGWSGIGLSPPLPGPVVKYTPFATVIGLSEDFSTSVLATAQAIDGLPPQPGTRIYMGHPLAPYQSLTPVGGNPADFNFAAGNPDFSRVYFTAAPQSAEDLESPALYAWSQQEGLQPIARRPDGTFAPGARFVGPISADGSRALFISEQTLYLHTEGQPSAEVASPVNIDPGQPLISDQASLSGDGSSVLFTSHAELTPDANTGPAEAGRDLYRYDVATGQIVDLTADAVDPDGAQVRHVFGVSTDGSYIYFTADGNLAPGGTPGEPSLYLWHDGDIGYVAPAEGMSPQILLTGDGRTIAFASTEELTGYDNRDPSTGDRHSEVFVATVGEGIQCASCRADGTRPTSDSSLPVSGFLGRASALTEDGQRLFFESTDAVVPQASGGLRNVFEYEDGVAHAISPLGATSNVTFLAATASGDDVFFRTSENLVPNPNSGPSSVVDARVGGGFPIPVRGCTGVSCRGAASPPPGFAAPGSSSITGSSRVKKHKCGKGKVRRGKRCVKKPHKRRHHAEARKQRRSHDVRGAGK